jgi:hypothetical protein
VFKINASHFIWARLNFATNNYKISFELQSAILKLKSCMAVWYRKVTSLAAIICSFPQGLILLKHEVIVYELAAADWLCVWHCLHDLRKQVSMSNGKRHCHSTNTEVCPF